MVSTMSSEDGVTGTVVDDILEISFVLEGEMGIRWGRLGF